jgi:hypothetical protein
MNCDASAVTNKKLACPIIAAVAICSKRVSVCLLNAIHTIPMKCESECSDGI